MKGEQLILDFSVPNTDPRTVNIVYTDESDRMQSLLMIPKGLSFGRGSWWLEASSREGLYVRIRLTHVHAIYKVPV